jgi:hypothetical protein
MQDIDARLSARRNNCLEIKKMKDPIVEEAREIRDGIFKKCGNDLTALIKHLQRRQKANRRKIVRLSSKKIQAT